MRITNHDRIFLHKLDTSGKPNNRRTETADIVDLSTGGMKIYLNEPLFFDTLLQFCFDTGMHQDKKQGTARVRWCMYEKDHLRYCAGLAFNDVDTINTVRSRVPLPSN